MALRFGDLIFTRIDNFLYRRVASATGTWISHVGILTEEIGGRWQVIESRIPEVAPVSLERSIERSENRAYSIRRCRTPLSAEQIATMKKYLQSRLGTSYHLGFDYDSPKEFCSKLVYDTYRIGTGTEVGRLETFRDLLARKPDHPLIFWKLWFLGFIPWGRRTVSPASQYRCGSFTTLYESRKLNGSSE